MKTLCTLVGGPADGPCFLDVPPGDQETTLYHTPAHGPIQRLIYRRVGADRFAFIRAEPYTPTAAPPIAVTHREEKLPPPEIRDWERRSG